MEQGILKREQGTIAPETGNFPRTKGKPLLASFYEAERANAARRSLTTTEHFPETASAHLPGHRVG